MRAAEAYLAVSLIVGELPGREDLADLVVLVEDQSSQVDDIAGLDFSCRLLLSVDSLLGGDTLERQCCQHNNQKGASQNFKQD